MTTAAGQLSSSGVWGTIASGASTFGGWVADTAVAVGEAVASFFQACANHVSEHAEAYIWGTVGVLTGVAFIWVAALLIWGRKGDDTTQPTTKPTAADLFAAAGRDAAAAVTNAAAAAAALQQPVEKA